MSLDIYPHLPGYRTTLRDGNLKFAPPLPTTDGMLIIGHAADGPHENPRRPLTLAEAELLFGVPSETNTLLLAWQQAIDTGAEDVRLLRIPGRYADTTLDDILDVQGRYTGALYNDVTVQVTSEAFVIVAPDAKGGGTYTFDLKTDDTTPVDKTLAQLIEEVNDAQDVVTLLPSGDTNPDTTDTDDFTIQGPTALTGGYDTPADLSATLANTYQLLYDYEVDIVVQLDLYADTGAQQAAQNLAELCAIMSAHNRLTMGFIGTTILEDTSLSGIADYYDALMDLDNNMVVSVEGQSVDAGRFLAICVGGGVFRDRSSANLGLYTFPLATAAAGLLSTLPGQSAITNKTVYGVRALSYRFSTLQLDRLTGKRFVTFRPRAGRGIVVVDGPTTAAFDSDYARISTVRIVGDLTSALVAVSEPFIGEGTNIANRNALHTAVKNVLNNAQEAGAIQQFVFTIQATPAEQVQGILNIMLEIVPAFEIRKIRTVVTLRPEL